MCPWLQRVVWSLPSLIFFKASFCDPDVFSSSYLQAIVICRLLFTFSFSVCSKCYYSISVRHTVILTAGKYTSECHLSKEIKTMHIIQMAQEQHAIYFGYAFLGILGKFYRNHSLLSKITPTFFNMCIKISI